MVSRTRVKLDPMLCGMYICIFKVRTENRKFFKVNWHNIYMYVFNVIMVVGAKLRKYSLMI